ncbi:MAG: hypothetical protein DI623_06195 [Sphingomonas sanxanigenens]|uniref:RcnB family protein n=1 Tax=Sphingomonas sanxanigenens TaxID=397260 RepID=A0A2W5AE37_9SPHN|nr:MAG: hypothetical protein DI623_06195 [Sphingomonas sanxanigenens]
MLPTKPAPGQGARPPRPSRPAKPPRPGNGHRPPSGGGWHRPPSWGNGGRPPNFRPINRPGWQYPPGYRYRRWSIGFLLPALFLSSTYYFDDWNRYGLPRPPMGYRWVRYGPDLLLVWVATGRVEDVIYDAFY